MQFLIETERCGDSAAKVREVALAPTLAEALRLVADACGDHDEALGALADIGLAPEGELAGEWGGCGSRPPADRPHDPAGHWRSEPAEGGREDP
jgi:hypothetical protein